MPPRSGNVKKEHWAACSSIPARSTLQNALGTHTHTHLTALGIGSILTKKTKAAHTARPITNFAKLEIKGKLVRECLPVLCARMR